MKILILMLAILLLTGCATTELTYNQDGSVTWKSVTWWKDVKDATIDWGPMSATLGSSIGNGGESAMMNNVIACYLSPMLCAE